MCTGDILNNRRYCRLVFNFSNPKATSHNWRNSVVRGAFKSSKLDLRTGDQVVDYERHRCGPSALGR